MITRRMETSSRSLIESTVDSVADTKVNFGPSRRVHAHLIVSIAHRGEIVESTLGGHPLASVTYLIQKQTE